MYATFFFVIIPLENIQLESQEEEDRLWGRTIAQAVSRRLPTAVARFRSRVVMWDLWWTKWHWDRFTPSTSVSPAKSHSTDCSTLGWYNRPVSGRRRFSPSTSVSPANLHSTNCSTIAIIYHLGPEVAAVPSGLSPTPLIINNNK
jgi:hypothetical protein